VRFILKSSWYLLNPAQDAKSRPAKAVVIPDIEGGRAFRCFILAPEKRLHEDERGVKRQEKAHSAISS